MSTTKSKQNQPKKYLYKLLDSFEEKDLYVIKSFLEFLHKSKSNGDDLFLKRLLSSDYEKVELNDKTKEEINKARAEVKKKKYTILDKVMKEFAI